ncbi:MAG: ZIP family metal transporter [Thermoanaerobaculia bacterium]
MKPEARRAWLPGLLLGLLPLVLLGGLVALILRTGLADAVRGEAPPIEALSFQRVELTPGGLVVEVLNDGPDPVRIAQVQVDEAYWAFTLDPPGALGRLGRARIDIPYPWVKDEAHLIRLVSSTGLTFDRQIPVAVATPRPGWRFFWLFALIGLYVGVIPVTLGLLWYPLVGRLGPRALGFLLALTVGLLLFLLVDAAHEGLEAVEKMPAAFQGLALFVFGAFAAYLGIEAFGGWLAKRRAGAGAVSAGWAGSAGWATALLVAIGIGLHNLGEGLAIGAALGLGEVALGRLLILGFTLHNTTEGLAIVAPIARTPVSLGRLLVLGLIGSLPTIAGAWLGGFVYSPTLSVLFLALGAGAIAQVIVQIAKGMAAGRPLADALRSGPVMAGLLAGFALMYTTGMLVQ